MGHGMTRDDRSHQDGAQGLGMEHKLTGRDARWDMGHWDGMRRAGLAQELVGWDTGQWEGT